MAKLTVVPTPIGNLGDMTYRAVEALKEASYILAEDTRTTSILLKHYKIEKRLVSHHLHNEHRKVNQITELMKAGDNVALVSDAGTPGISDPGFMLIRECIRKGIEVECLPGATACIPALVLSSLPADRFYFEGFLPTKKGRQTRLNEIATAKHTSIIYESPLKLLKTLQNLCEACGEERQISVSRELTKIHEETIRGTIAEVIKHFIAKPPRGEIVIVVSGAN
ncbi:MAG: 16S rRNA (cytidine(1402)-2'-O)-methyltransferase [Tannerella sp.]|jgi:16S rRNA (cytidine1402-2'-O)-methyltransferase|nr:16S rRNA (cytidine(1402)-2'-O)-methyltransferase [Tannerella sp.]